MKAFKNLSALLGILSFLFSFYNEELGRIIYSFSEIHLHTLAFSFVFFLSYKGLKHVILREAKQVLRK